MAKDHRRRGAVVVMAGSLPKRSETFVTREVRGLRNRGWSVVPVSLHTSPDQGLAEFSDLQGSLVVYGRSRRIVGCFIMEFLRHPLRTVQTLALACWDALIPGESARLSTRMRIPLQCLAAIALGRRLRSRVVRHIHCHFAHAPTTLGMYVARHLGISFSFAGHANDLFQRRSLLLRKLERAAFVSCISEWHRQLYGSICTARKDRYFVIRCGVPVEPMRPRVGEMPNPPVVVTVARLVEKKGIDTLLRAVGSLSRQSGFRAVLRIAGDGPERLRLEELGDLEGCDVAWLGSIRNEAVRGVLSDATVFALPCRVDERGDRDGIPVALMEAMASGIPCISGDLPAIRELIEDERSGLLVDGSSPDSVAASLARLFRDQQLRDSLAANGHAKILEEFNLDLNLERLERCLEASITG